MVRAVLSMVKVRLRRFPIVLRLHSDARAAAVRLRGARRGFSRWALTVGLIAAYFFAVTPIAVVRRRLLGRSLVNPRDNSDRGWRPVRQSSADKRIYLSDS
jgi:hypothetical protein